MSSLLEEIHEEWVNLNSQKITSGIFKNKIRINVIYKDADLDGKCIENKHSAEIKFETA